MSAILLVEDEIAIAETVVYALQADGHTVRHCLDGQQARAAVLETAFDLAILDVGLPDISGFALCGELRRHAPLPVIFLTAQAAESERVLGFDLGADDYIAKPFSLRELVARVRVVVRRGVPETAIPEAKRTGAFEHDVDGRRIRYHDSALDLTRYEYGLLAALLARPGAVLSRMQLMERVWDDAPDSGDRTVDTHIKTLRGKLRAVAPAIDPLRTHRGIGYSLDID
ncbi:two-component system response regulator CreB [Luteimonas sp. 3794]|uniref:two-component system response regulator CreB n=1 Tax=Luteimonas sp. 3794 TaxID=2817730 RepID=UPI00285B9837|nr:two-component system response regulator CreB [Luteimonas sp. 3794]MDR6992834.1 two-component system catabolic regulation response regulator CreB [Luteimonas sp. 3794]